MTDGHHYCQHCGSRAPRFLGNQFRCRICSELTVLPAEGATVDGRCGACGRSFGGTARFCPWCGQASPPPATTAGAAVHCSACGVRNARPAAADFRCQSCGARTVVDGPEDETDGVCDACGAWLYFDAPDRPPRFCPACGSEELLDRLGRKPVDVAARIAAVRQATVASTAAAAPRSSRRALPDSPDRGR